METTKKRSIWAIALAFIAAACLAMALVPKAFATQSSGNDVADSDVTITGLVAGDQVEAFLIADIDIEANNNLIYKFATGVPEAYDTIEELTAVTSDGNSFTQGTDMQNAAAAIALGIVGNGAAATAIAGDDTATLTLGSGYYLVRVTSTSGNTKVYQNMIVDVSPDVEAGAYVAAAPQELAVKSTEVTIDKTLGGEQNPDTYTVGEKLPFSIATAIPNYPADSTYATFVIGDAPSAGIVINPDSIVVTAGTAVEGKDYTVTVNSGVMTIEFDKAFILANPGMSVTVAYEATLTSDAFSTTDGVTSNGATVSFNPNPYKDTTVETGDKVVVQTYGYVFDKVDADGNPLEGAIFTLYDGNGNAVLDENGEAVTSKSTIVDGKAYVYFEDLGAGEYVAKETTVPAGHLAAADVKFTVDKDVCTENNPATTDIVENNYLINNVSVVDPDQPVLPVTGGMGTMLFTLIGVLLIGAAVFMLVRSRKTQE